MIRRPPRSTLSSSSAASDVYKRQPFFLEFGPCWGSPHVTVTLTLKDGTVLPEVFSDNLPSVDEVTLLSREAPDNTLTRTLTAAMTISLGGLCAGDPSSVRTTVGSLEKRGFVFVEFPPDLQMDRLAAAASFLSGPGRATGSDDAVVGHVSSAFKDSIRLVTGDQFGTNPDLPNLPALRELCDDLDTAQRRIVAALAEPLFRCADANQVGTSYSIPLLDRSILSSSFGLVDVARYARESPGGMAVDEHVDPGLLILALPQQGEGLELCDHDGAWRAPPPGIGVLWVGEATAAQLGIPGGKHRVQSSSQRLSCWHELCTADQISPPMLARLEAENRELELGPIKGTNAVLKTLRLAEDRHPESMMALGFGGAPMSKSGAW
eukprot:TRINITY_DN50067_c0_g1_i1.p1 TRINITY_DN50067_c0_g1~~TRINITY_DN50067_c0_g1_i1.p1  ORF type:complete len:379 (+),score=67.49 TRINITY_DN50067_c0_g1_i1:140-1276(+)